MGLAWPDATGAIAAPGRKLFHHKTNLIQLQRLKP